MVIIKNIRSGSFMFVFVLKRVAEISCPIATAFAVNHAEQISGHIPTTTKHSHGILDGLLCERFDTVVFGFVHGVKYLELAAEFG